VKTPIIAGGWIIPALLREPVYSQALRTKQSAGTGAENPVPLGLPRLQSYTCAAAGLQERP